MLASLSTAGHPMVGTAPLVGNIICFITAGTTQTQVGGTAITAPIAKVTTGNANDGVNLPDGSNPANIGMVVRVQNLSANALKVYPYYGLSIANPVTAAASGGNISATSSAGTANVFFAHTASLTFDYVLVGLDVWKAVQLS